MSVAGTRVLVIVINISIHLMADSLHHEPRERDDDHNAVYLFGSRFPIDPPLYLVCLEGCRDFPPVHHFDDNAGGNRI